MTLVFKKAQYQEFIKTYYQHLINFGLLEYHKYGRGIMVLDLGSFHNSYQKKAEVNYHFPLRYKFKDLQSFTREHQDLIGSYDPEQIVLLYFDNYSFAEQNIYQLAIPKGFMLLSEDRLFSSSRINRPKIVSFNDELVNQFIRYNYYFLSAFSYLGRQLWGQPGVVHCNIGRSFYELNDYLHLTVTAQNFSNLFISFSVDKLKEIKARSSDLQGVNFELKTVVVLQFGTHNCYKIMGDKAYLPEKSMSRLSPELRDTLELYYAR